MALERGSFVLGEDRVKTLKRVSRGVVRLDEEMRNTYGKMPGDTDLRVAICGHNLSSEWSWGNGPGPGPGPASLAVPKGQAEDSIVIDAKK